MGLRHTGGDEHRGEDRADVLPRRRQYGGRFLKGISGGVQTRRDHVPAHAGGRDPEDTPLSSGAFQNPHALRREPGIRR